MELNVIVVADEFLRPDNAPASAHYLKFTPADDAGALAGEIGDADVLIVRRTRVTEALLRAGPRLRLVQQVGIGTDRIDLTAARRLGIPVANTPGAVTTAVVEHAVLLALAAARGLLVQNSRVRGGEWSTLDIWESTEISGSVVGVVGFGSIGRGFVRRMLAFDAKILVSSRTQPTDLPPAVRAVGLDELLKESDTVLLAVPLTPTTRGLLGARELALMKPSAILVNVARGEVVDEEALVAALSSGRLRAAALDVFAGEPLSPDSPLRTLPNVVATPHYAGASRASRERIWQQVLENLDRLAAGAQPGYVVNL